MPHHAGAPVRRLGPSIAAVIAAVLLVTALAGTVAAKESVVVTLDAPIAMDSPPGAVLLVGITGTASDTDGEPVPVIGTPFYLKLTGRNGATTRAAAEGTATPGHYLLRIEVPAGGPRDIEVGIHGSNQDGPVALPVRLEGPALTFGPIREGTSQLDPAALSAAPATGSGAPAAPAGQAGVSVAPAVGNEPAPAADAGPGLPILVLVVVLAATVLLAMAGRLVTRQRTARGAGGAGGAARGG